MKLHPTNVTAVRGERLGVEIVQMRYDHVIAVMDGMIKEFNDQAFADRLRNRPLIATLLYEVAEHLSNAASTMDAIYDICERYIEEEKSFLESQS